MGRGVRAFQSIQSVVLRPDVYPHAAVQRPRRLCGGDCWPGVGRCDQGPDADGHSGKDYGGGAE